ncbi:hypothetical protein ACIA5D_07040 [Actinoplanes sp. NPDC051513]|uniref:hypothetical protein n=1 Tax=Actinoplanes sp. NPDC051513 TaxID=3363908 RepID=UPI003792A820
MRTRHSFTAAVIALIAILIGVIITLLIGGGPDANADEPTPTPSSAEPSPPPQNKTSPSRTGKGSHPTKPGRTKPTKPPTKPTSAPAKPPLDPPAAVGPRFGNAKVPSDADCSVSGDGQAFTARFSSLESGTDIGRPSRTQKVTIAVTGDGKGKNLRLSISGYVFTERDVTAKLTVTVNGGGTTVTYQPNHDLELLRSIDIPLRGVHELRITVKVEVNPEKKDAGGYLNVSALDGLIE